MGYLTPILMYNDTMHDIKNDPYFNKNLCNITHKGGDVYVHSYRKTKFDAFLKFFGLYRMPKENEWRGSSDCANVLKSEHADCHRVIVIYGNTWCELTQELYGKNNRTDKIYTDYVKDCISIAQRTVTDLKKKMKETK